MHFSQKIILFIFILSVVTPQYLKAQSPQKEAIAVKSLLDEALKIKLTDSAQASRTVREGLSVAEKYNDIPLICACNSTLATIQEFNGQHQRAQFYYLEELKHVDKVADSIKFQIYSDLGYNFRKLGKFQEAKHYVGQEYTLAAKMNDPQKILVSYVDLGVLYSTFNDLSTASEYLIKACDLGEKLEDFDQASDSYRALAFLYIKTKNFPLALENSEKSIVCAAKNKDESFPHHQILLSNVFILKETGHYPKAIERAKKVIEQSLKIGDKTTLTKAYFYLADCYSLSKDFSQSESYFEQAKALLSNLEMVEYKTFYLNYGSLKLKKKELSQAIALFQQSIAFAEKEKSNYWLLKNYNMIAEAYEAMKKPDSALISIKKANIFKDSLYAENNAKGVLEAKFKYDLTKSEAEIKELRIKNDVNLIKGAFVFVIFMFAFLGYFLHSNRLRNRILLENNKAIADKNQELEDANDMMRQLAFASAHDLKEPLRNINSFTNIIQKRYLKSLPEEAGEYMGFVTHGVVRMEKMLNALLEISSLFDKDIVQAKENDVTKILERIFTEYEDQILAENAQISYPSVFPKIVMKEAYLKQIFSNLLSNALKFSKGDVKIEVGYMKKNDDLVFFMKDNGIGLDESYSHKVFKLFRRLDVSMKQDGAGVGLTIAKNIVEKYKGEIWYESKNGQGTTFFFSFPMTMIFDCPASMSPPQYWQPLVATQQV
jgi:signal transduction histidine kinase/tetratricopeptide (TPR) repeat protein